MKKSKYSYMLAVTLIIVILTGRSQLDASANTLLTAVNNLSLENTDELSNDMTQQQITAQELRESLLADLRSTAMQNTQEAFYIEKHPKLLAYIFMATKDYTTSQQILSEKKQLTSEQFQTLRTHKATYDTMQRLDILEGLPFDKVVENIANIIRKLDMESGKGLAITYLGETSLPYEKKLRSTFLPKTDVHPLLLNRWSAHDLSNEHLTKEEIDTLIDAARWAPSSFNNQPWRFIYAHRKTEHWEKIFSTIQPRNQRWAIDAGTLFVLLSKKTLDGSGKFDKSHSFSTGAACQNFLLQASSMKLVTRCMDRFDFDALRKILNVPNEYEIEVIIAVGKPGNHQDTLPADLQKRNRPSDRKPISEIMFKNTFPS